MKTSTKRILSILFSAFFLLAALVVYGSLIQPEIQNASKLQGLVASKSELYNNQKAAVTQVTSLISQFQSSAAKLQQTVGLAVPIGPNITQALNQWQAIAAANQVSLESLDIQPGQSSNPKAAATQALVKRLNSIPTEVNVMGSYGSLKQFLNSTETNARVMNVSAFNLKVVTDNKSSGIGSNNISYSMQLNVVAFYQEN
jgi:Tfp pilus assembly protein PilO